jgi:hypothetical protein
MLLVTINMHIHNNIVVGHDKYHRENRKSSINDTHTMSRSAANPFIVVSTLFVDGTVDGTVDGCVDVNQRQDKASQTEQGDDQEDDDQEDDDAYNEDTKDPDDPDDPDVHHTSFSSRNDPEINALKLQIQVLQNNENQMLAERTTLEQENIAQKAQLASVQTRNHDDVNALEKQNETLTELKKQLDIHEQNMKKNLDEVNHMEKAAELTCSKTQKKLELSESENKVLKTDFQSLRLRMTQEIQKSAAVEAKKVDAEFRLVQAIDNTEKAKRAETLALTAAEQSKQAFVAANVKATAAEAAAVVAKSAETAAVLAANQATAQTATDKTLIGVLQQEVATAKAEAAQALTEKQTAEQKTATFEQGMTQSQTDSALAVTVAQASELVAQEALIAAQKAAHDAAVAASVTVQAEQDKAREDNEKAKKEIALLTQEFKDEQQRHLDLIQKYKEQAAKEETEYAAAEAQREEQQIAELRKLEATIQGQLQVSNESAALLVAAEAAKTNAETEKEKALHEYEEQIDKLNKTISAQNLEIESLRGIAAEKKKEQDHSAAKEASAKRKQDSERAQHLVQETAAAAAAAKKKEEDDSAAKEASAKRKQDIERAHDLVQETAAAAKKIADAAATKAHIEAIKTPEQRAAVEKARQKAQNSARARAFEASVADRKQRTQGDFIVDGGTRGRSLDSKGRKSGAHGMPGNHAEGAGPTSNSSVPQSNPTGGITGPELKGPDAGGTTPAGGAKSQSKNPSTRGEYVPMSKSVTPESDDPEISVWTQVPTRGPKRAGAGTLPPVADGLRQRRAGQGEEYSLFV